MPDETVEKLLRLDQDDEITFTVDGDEYRGRVTSTYRSKAKRKGGMTRSAGHRRVSLKLTNGTVQSYGFPDPRARILVEERYVGSFDWPIASYYDPEKDPAPDKYADCGRVDTVTLHSR